MFTYSQRGSVKYLEAEILRQCDSIIHAFCSRWGGVSEGRFSNFNFSISEGDGSEQVLKNWTILSDAFMIPVADFCTVRQVHEDGILIIDGSTDVSSVQNGDYDAIITNRTGLAVGVKTADCVPIFLFDPVRNVVGVVHAGWRGTAKKIAVKAIRRFQEKFSTKTEDVVAAIGPAIGPCCYEVDRVVRDAMEDHGAEVSTPSGNLDRWMFDLPMANRLQLLDAGVTSVNIVEAGICTSCNRDTFFSHRGEGGGTGRQLSFLMIR